MSVGACLFVCVCVCVSVHACVCVWLPTDELVQEDKRGDVGGQAEELGHDHQPVPGLDGQGHHEQLSEDERGEGDGHDVDKLRLKQQQGPVHDDAA